MPAHPRSRGENLEGLAGLLSGLGSSPLTRGKPAGHAASVQDARLIPAHAGKTPGGPRGRYLRWAHPRSRGENRTAVARGLSRRGSSPLTRGKLSSPCDRSQRGRLIPAHAGKTSTRQPAHPPGTAHPRSRGENLVAAVDTIPDTGSSPLTRGKHFLTCAFTAQIDQILETLELAASFGSYLIWVACATDAPQDPVRSIGLVLPSSMGAS